MVAEHGRIKKCEPDDQSHAGTGGHGGVPPPEIIRRIEGRQEVEHQSHALRSDQKVVMAAMITRNSSRNSSLVIFRKPPPAMPNAALRLDKVLGLYMVD